MEPIVSSETSAVRTQAPGNYPKRNKLQGITCWTKVVQTKTTVNTHTHKWLRESKDSLPLLFDGMVHNLTSYSEIAPPPIAKRNTNLREVNLSPEPEPLFLELTVLCRSFLKLVRGEWILFLTFSLPGCGTFSLYFVSKTS